MKPLFLDGLIYSRDAIECLREEMISIRDEALKHNQFHIAVTISHTIALLNHLKENTDD